MCETIYHHFNQFNHFNHHNHHHHPKYRLSNIANSSQQHVLTWIVPKQKDHIYGFKRKHPPNPSIRSDTPMWCPPQKGWNKRGDVWNMLLGRFPNKIKQVPNLDLVGGWPTPLKNDGVRQLGFGWHPIDEIENTSHVWNQQPVDVFFNVENHYHYNMQSLWTFPIYGKINNVWNHQPVDLGQPGTPKPCSSCNFILHSCRFVQGTQCPQHFSSLAIISYNDTTSNIGIIIMVVSYNGYNMLQSLLPSGNLT